MINKFLLIAFRKMNRQRFYSGLNVIGLTIGIIGAIFIFLWVHDEKSYDKFHKNSDRIYRIYQVFHYGEKHLEQTQTPFVLALKIKEECPEVEMVTRVRGFRSENIVVVDNQNFNEKGLGIADEYFFQVFSFSLISGDPQTVLSKPNTIVISAKTAKKYFGDSIALGKVISTLGVDFTVSGIFEDMPNQSHFHLDIVCSLNSFTQYEQPNWGLNVFKTYVLLGKDNIPKDFGEKLQGIVKNHMFTSPEQYESVIERGDYTRFLLQPLKDIHLKSNLLWEFEPNGNATYVNFFTIIAVFILVIAIINYINLSTAKSIGRSKEVGIRKTLGSTRKLLIYQFLSESILMSLLAMLLAIIAIYLILPEFRNLVGKDWLINPISENPLILVPFLFLAIIIGVVAGIYPSFVLSSFKPVSAICNKLDKSFKGTGLRNGLVVFQFIISVVLLIMTIVVQKQMDFIQSKDIGYNNEQVIVVKTFGQLNTNLQLLKDKLKTNPSILSMSASSSLPGTQFTNIGMGLEGSDSNHGTNLFLADEDFLETMQMKIFKGRYFSSNFQTDSQAVVINESMAKNLVADSLLEKRLMIWAGGQGIQPFPIIGIVKDFHYESFHEAVKPMVIVKLYGTCPWSEAYFSIRIKEEEPYKTVKFVQNIWENVMPGTPFEYSFLDSIYDLQYKNEQRTGQVFFLFTLFMIFVACLGLLGMASFTVERRTKEIAIRKVMGAKTKQIMLLLTSDFMRWTILATIIAWPVSFLLMEKWLNQFSYRIGINIWPFLYATILILIITLLTVVFHALKASVKNPVNSLRYE